MADLWRDHDVGRVARHAHAGQPVLNDVERGEHDACDARAAPAAADDAAHQFAFRIALPGEVFQPPPNPVGDGGCRLGGVFHKLGGAFRGSAVFLLLRVFLQMQFLLDPVLDVVEKIVAGQGRRRGADIARIDRLMRAAARGGIEGIGVEIDGDDDAGAERAGDGDRDRVHQRTVDQPAAIDGDGREDAGKRIGGADRLNEVALVQPELVAGGEFGRDADEGLLQVFDVDVGKLFAHQFGELGIADEAGGAEAEVEQAQHAAARQRARELLERFELAGDEAAADKGANGGAGDDVGLDAGALERFQDADMCPAARYAGAESYADFGAGHAELLHGQGDLLQTI